MSRAIKPDLAIVSVNNALASHGEARPGAADAKVRQRAQIHLPCVRIQWTALGLRLEYILCHTPEQNGFVESFHKTLKRKYIWPRDSQDYQEAERAIEEALVDYNRRRIHSSLGYLTPMEYMDAWKRGKVKVEAKVNS